MHNTYILSAIVVVVLSVSCIGDGKNHPHCPSPKSNASKIKEEKAAEPLNDTTTHSEAEAAELLNDTTTHPEAATSDTSEPHGQDTHAPKQQESTSLSGLENLIQEIEAEIQQFETKN